MELISAYLNSCHLKLDPMSLYRFNLDYSDHEYRGIYVGCYPIKGAERLMLQFDKIMIIREGMQPRYSLYEHVQEYHEDDIHSIRFVSYEGNMPF